MEQGCAVDLVHVPNQRLKACVVAAGPEDGDRSCCADEGRGGEAVEASQTQILHLVLRVGLTSDLPAVEHPGLKAPASLKEPFTLAAIALSYNSHSH